MTITEFLTARWDEDEAVARAASPGTWTYRGVESVSGSTLYDETRSIARLDYDQDDDERSVGRSIYEAEADANGAHIARHDPARVLADIAAKRAILEELVREEAANFGDQFLDGLCSGLERSARLLAQPYAEHPDYDESWKP